jgi:hypothetical protein
MKNKTLQLAGVLALLAVIGKYYAVPAYAQVRAALVQDRDNVARNFYQMQLSCTVNTFGYCSIDYPAVPAGKRLIITHVSSIESMPAQNTITSIDLRTKGSVIGAFMQALGEPANTVGGSEYTTNDNVLVGFDAGQQPEFIVFTNSAANFTTVANISGYMIDIP